MSLSGTEAERVGPPPESHPLNRWMAHLVFGGLCVSAAFAVVAVPLAMVGWFRVVTVVIATAVAAAALLAWARPNPIVIDASAAATGCAIVIVAAVTLLGVLFPTQHFTTNRDPGVYSSMGLWVSEEGDLLFEGVPPLFDDIPGIDAAGGGFYETRDDGRLYAQFSHLTHVLLATADGLAGPAALVRINVLVGGAALLVLFVVGQRVTSGWPAVIAVAAVAASLPQIYFSRGPYSEPITQLLLMGGIAVLVGPSRLRTPQALLAGLLLGGVVGARIDGILIVCALVCLVVYFALIREGLPGNGRSLLALAGGAATTISIGIVDLRIFSPHYFDHLSTPFRQAALAAIGLSALGALLIAARSARRALGARAGRHRGALASAAGAVVGAVLTLLLIVRPHVQEVRGRTIDLVAGIQGRQGLEVDGTRYYFEQSFLWFTWYLGWPLVIAGIIGAAVCAWRVVARDDWRCGVLLIVLGLPTLVYLWRPTITPDQIWAMRRHLPFGFPWIALSAAVAIDSGRRLLARRRFSTPARRAYLTAAALLAVVPALLVSRPYLDHREHRLTYGTIDEICRLIDRSPTLIDEAGNLGSTITQPLAASCDAPIAHADLSDPAVVTAARAAANDDGEELVLVTSRRDDVALSTRQRGTVPLVLNEIERSLERAPRGLEPNQPTTIDVLVVP